MVLVFEFHIRPIFCRNNVDPKGLKKFSRLWWVVLGETWGIGLHVTKRAVVEVLDFVVDYMFSSHLWGPGDDPDGIRAHGRLVSVRVSYPGPRRDGLDGLWWVGLDMYVTTAIQLLYLKKKKLWRVCK